MTKMATKTLCSVLILISFLSAIQCQVYYQPIQVLFPTNGTHYLASNYSIYNKTNARPPNYNVYNNSYNSYYNRYNRTYNNSYYNGSQDGHLILGTVSPYDRLLFDQTFYKPSRWWTYREKIIEYPKDLPSGYLRHETISAISVLNQFYDGNTARATLQAGGIGQQYVKIRIASKYSKGFRYIVRIYGR